MKRKASASVKPDAVPIPAHVVPAATGGVELADNGAADVTGDGEATKAIGVADGTDSGVA
jgi:hypothetical protein